MTCEVGAIDPFDFAQGRLSIARVATALPAAPKKSKRKQIKQKATKLFCLGRNGIFVSFVIFCLKFLNLCNRGLAKPKTSASPDRYTEGRLRWNALSSTRWQDGCGFARSE